MVTTAGNAARLRLLSPHEASQVEPRAIGGKAAGLVRLGQLGVRVPHWVVLPAAALREQLVAARLDEQVSCLLADLASIREPRTGDVAAASDALRRIVGALALDDSLREALTDAPAILGEAAYAVRSSGVGEDGLAHSFAGQFDTVLDVRGEQELANAVRNCWSSAFSDRALAYRLRTGTIDQATDLAVIIQRMIVGETSGVLFTTDPLTGDPRRVRISACRGSGEQLVSGAIDGDEIVTDRQGVIAEVRLAGSSPVIDAVTAHSLVHLATAVAEAEGAARDIEWTIAKGRIWFLQSRPVTPRTTAPPPTGGIVWDNSNIQESYCGVTTPLTFSFARAAYEAVYTQTMRAVGIHDSVIDAHRDVVNGLLGLIHGRVYYNLNNWYRGLLLLPAFRRNKADMERMMGVEEPVDFVEDETPSRIERMRRAPTMVLTAIGLARRFMTIERDTVAFLSRFDALVASVDRSTIANRSLAELADLLRLLRRDGIKRWTTPIINDFRVMMTTGRLRRIVQRAIGNHVDEVLQTLLGGADVAVSSAPAMLMLRMADVIRRSPQAFAAMTDGQPDALARAAESHPEVAALLRKLLDQYGDRCMGELKLESRSLRDDPAFITTMVLNYLRANRPDADTTARQASERRGAIATQLLQRMSPLARVRFRMALRSARAGIRAREAMRLARARLFGIHREVYRAIGVRLHEQARLGDPSDVFYLTVEEVAKAIDSEFDVAALVRTRRTTFAGFTQLPAPNRIVTASVPDPFAPVVDVGDTRAVGVTNGRFLQGLGCSAGVAEGPVRIVSGPDDDLAIDGHVLVATRTDPGWAPLFHTAAAIVVERGSVLSHSAVLARELGLPAVVGIPGLVTTLRDGERVRVDGTAGTIERLDHQ